MLYIIKVLHHTSLSEDFLSLFTFETTNFLFALQCLWNWKLSPHSLKLFVNSTPLILSPTGVTHLQKTSVVSIIAGLWKSFSVNSFFVCFSESVLVTNDCFKKVHQYYIFYKVVIVFITHLQVLGELYVGFILRRREFCNSNTTSLFSLSVFETRLWA